MALAGPSRDATYGPLNETPDIDALAERGVRFTTAYASSTVCSSSRAGLMTGQAPQRSGITDYLRPFAEWFIPLKEGSSSDNELPEDTDYRLDADSVVLPQMFKIPGAQLSHSTLCPKASFVILTKVLIV